MSLVTSKGKLDNIDTEYTICHGYYIVIFPRLHAPLNKTLILMDK